MASVVHSLKEEEEGREEMSDPNKPTAQAKAMASPPLPALPTSRRQGAKPRTI
jgi:hypothetical protein